MEEESLIKNSSACKDYLIEAMKYHLLPADQRALMKTARTRMRTPACCPKVLAGLLNHRSSLLLPVAARSLHFSPVFSTVQVMVVVGGQAPKAIRSVECYDFEEQRWYQVAELPTRRCRAGRKTSMTGSLRNSCTCCGLVIKMKHFTSVNVRRPIIHIVYIVSI